MKETEKILKAKQLRYKKPIVKNLNLDYIIGDLWEISEECDNVRWYTDSEDGTDSLINALNGDEDEAYEFKMAFADLCAECEMMQNDLQNEYVPECFDIFFVAVGADDGGLLGYDDYEQDYFRFDAPDEWAVKEAKKKIERMTKAQMMEAAMYCFRIYQSYIGLRNRYDSLKAAIDILRDQNTGYLQAVKKIEELYEKAAERQKDHMTWFGGDDEYSKEARDWKKYTDALPAEAWIQ